MKNIKSNLFSPINSVKYCDYFYILTIFAFVVFIFALFKTILSFSLKQTGWDHFLSAMMILTKFLIYGQCRLLYSMCVH
jgi:hypothetical protein